MINDEVWVVTGAGGGMGSALTRKLLQRGTRVAALSREPETVRAACGDSGALLVLETDVSDESGVQAARREILKRFGRFDAVVNAAGYALGGAIEEISDAEARRSFEVNVFGMLNVCRNFVPDLREQGHGLVITFASDDAISATACNALHHAAQFAADALTDALNKEMGQFGLRAVCVKSGPIRTAYLDHKVRAEKKIGAYDGVRGAADARDAALRGKEPADPEKVAELLIRLSGEAEMPKNLYLTRESVARAREKWAFLENEFEEWKWATLCVDFPKEECYFGKRG